MTCKLCCKSGYIKQKLFSKNIYIYIKQKQWIFGEKILYIYIYIYLG